MNNKSLQDLVKGCYGRKILYTDVETITKDNIVKVVGDCIGNYGGITKEISRFYTD